MPHIIFGRGIVKAVLLLNIAAIILMEFFLRRQFELFHRYEVALLSLDWILVVWLVAWCGYVLSLAFKLNDFLVIGLLLFAIIAYLIGHAAQAEADTLVLLAGATLGRGAALILKSRKRNLEGGKNSDAGSFEPETR